MKRFTRGTKVDFSIVFYDSAGAVAVPESAALTVNYPTDNYPLDGTDLLTKTSAMTLNADGETWKAACDTSVSGIGRVFWSAVSSDPDLTVEQGEFNLIGNAATLTATAS